MAAVKEFIEKYLPRIWPHPVPTVTSWDADLPPLICHSPTGNSHEHPTPPHTHRQDDEHTFDSKDLICYAKTNIRLSVQSKPPAFYQWFDDNISKCSHSVSLSILEGEALTHNTFLLIYLSNLCVIPPRDLFSTFTSFCFNLFFFCSYHVLHSFHCHAFLSNWVRVMLLDINGSHIVRLMPPWWCQRSY